MHWWSGCLPSRQSSGEHDCVTASIAVVKLDITALLVSWRNGGLTLLYSEAPPCQLPLLCITAIDSHTHIHTHTHTHTHIHTHAHNITQYIDSCSFGSRELHLESSSRDEIRRILQRIHRSVAYSVSCMVAGVSQISSLSNR